MKHQRFSLYNHLKMSIIFTARKQSLRSLCFYTCLSFCSQGGGASQHAVGQTPQKKPGRPPPRKKPGRLPPGRHSPGRNLEDPRKTYPPGAVHAGRYEQQAGSTHPTGMHTCLFISVVSKARKVSNHTKVNNSAIYNCIVTLTL